MPHTDLLDYNGELLPADQSIFNAGNRAFRYGDGIFESMRMLDNQLPFLQRHWSRLQLACEALKLELPGYFSAGYIQQQALKVAEAKGITRNARLRLAVFRTAGGYYLPQSSKAEYLLEVNPVVNDGFPLNDKGLKVGLYTDIEKPANRFSLFKTSNALLNVLAALHRDEQQLDDCLLINTSGRVIESIDSNLFIVKDGIVCTPPLSEGCVAGVMREHIMDICRYENIRYAEAPLAIDDLLSADEMFVTNAVQGIRWVEQYLHKRYSRENTFRLSAALNSDTHLHYTQQED